MVPQVRILFGWSLCCAFEVPETGTANFSEYLSFLIGNFYIAHQHIIMAIGVIPQTRIRPESGAFRMAVYAQRRPTVPGGES